MIYTIGRRESYNEVHRQGGTSYKLGRRQGYAGGSVWRTPQEAAAHIDKHDLTDYGVYIVDADWATETAPPEHQGATWRDLLRDAKIIGFWHAGTDYFYGTYETAMYEAVSDLGTTLLEAFRGIARGFGFKIP